MIPPRYWAVPLHPANTPVLLLLLGAPFAPLPWLQAIGVLFLWVSPAVHEHGHAVEAEREGRRAELVMTRAGPRVVVTPSSSPSIALAGMLHAGIIAIPGAILALPWLPASLAGLLGLLWTVLGGLGDIRDAVELHREGVEKGA